MSKNAVLQVAGGGRPEIRQKYVGAEPARRGPARRGSARPRRPGLLAHAAPNLEAWQASAAGEVINAFLV